MLKWLARLQTPIKFPNEGPNTRWVGNAAEDRALALLESQGLSLLARQFKTPGRGGGEVDLIMQTPDGTVVFVEVRARFNTTAGGAAASVTATKQRRIALAASHYLRQLAHVPACRFDVVAIDGTAAPHWIQAAFDSPL